MPTPSTDVRNEIDLSVRAVAKKLALDVQWIRYEITSDWSGDRAIFFRIVLSDDAARDSRLARVTRHVESVLAKELEPLAPELLFYYNFRSRSEQARIKEPAWSKA